MLIEAAGADVASFSAAGSTTSALVVGSGRPLLLLHGLNAAGGLAWWPVFSALAEHYRVCAPDLPGLGVSEPLDGRPDSDRLVHWLSAVMRAFHSEPVVLVATSMGGAFALRLAATHSERVRALIVTDTAGLAPFRPPPGFIVATRLNALRPSEAALSRIVRYVIHDQEHVRQLHGPLWDIFGGYMVAQAGRQTVRQTMRGLASRTNARPVPGASLVSIDVPVGMIWGRHDRPFPLSIAESAKVRFGWPLSIIEDAGHLPYIERPTRFVQAVEAHTERA